MAFYISKVTATGDRKSPASVEFGNGLNIICGVSDSGKTCVLKCIQFAMGILKTPFDKEETGYNGVDMEVVTPNGKLYFSRSLGKNIVNVISEVSGINSGDYDTEYKSKGNKNPVLNELWLKLIGIEKLPMIIKNQNFERQRLTWKTLIHLFWIKEESIEHPGSALLPDVTTLHPYFFSCLLYLLTGNSYAEMEQQEKEEISKAKKEAVRQFVYPQLEKLAAKRKNLQKLLSDFGNLDVEAEMQRIIDCLSETENAVVSATNESRDLLGTLLEFKRQESELAITSSQFQALKLQYVADIKRLSFITDGESKMRSIPKGVLRYSRRNGAHSVKQESYITGAKAELTRIISQLKGLDESENDIILRLNDIRKKIHTLEKRIEEINTLVDDELIPRAGKLREEARRYRSYIQIRQEISVLSALSSEWSTELNRQTAINKNTFKFHPLEHFPEDFNESLDKISYAILEACQYEGLKTAHFNIHTFDLEINGKRKDISHGKGYWAFINTVLGLAFRQYLHESAIYKPGLFVIDTPLLGLDQGAADKTSGSMKTALFRYFMAHQMDGQMIVVENTNELPDLDYEQNGVSVIEFTHNKYKSRFSNSRYGFLHGVVSENDS